jgi:general secretion pathway protein D
LVLKYLFLLPISFSLLLAAADPSAKALARAAEKARNSGQVVRAYLLYSEAAARDPKNETYRVNRDGLKPLAKLLTKSGVEQEPSRDELLASVPPEIDEPLDELTAEDRLEMNKLQPPPKLAVTPARHSFHFRGNERALYEAVTSAYGVQVVFDPQIDPKSNIRLDLEDVDLPEALRAVTAITDSFVYALSPHSIFVARDTPQKRDEYEPETTAVIPLPDLVDDKATSEISNGVRQAFELRHIAMDSTARSIIIRDKLSRTIAAQAMLEALIRPKTQVAVDVKILLFDTQSTLNYGISLPNTFPVINFGQVLLNGGSFSLATQNFVNFLTFGGGRTLFGIGITNASALATATYSRSQSIYDATVVVDSGGTAQLHVGDKYPIAQSLYQGASQSTSALYLPPAQVQLVDLGVVLKVKPELHADGDVSMEISAEYQALGAQTINTVPEILQRRFEGAVRLHTGESAVLAGLNTQTYSVSRTGIAGISDIPAIKDLLSDVNRSTQNSQTLMLINPHPLRTFPTAELPSYYYGGERGRKVML